MSERDEGRTLSNHDRFFKDVTPFLIEIRCKRDKLYHPVIGVYR